MALGNNHILKTNIFSPKRLLMRQLLIIFFCFQAGLFYAQEQISIALLHDGSMEHGLEEHFSDGIKAEILQLLQHRYTVSFKEYYGSYNPQKIKADFEAAFQVEDLIISTGSLGSDIAIKLNTYPKPTIASIALDPTLQGLEKTTDGTSGLNNFTYLETAFNIERDLNTLYEIFSYEHLIVVTGNVLFENQEFIEQEFRPLLKNRAIGLSKINFEANISAHLATLGDKKAAAYILPYLGNDFTIVQSTIEKLNEAGIPSAAILGEDYLHRGVLVGYQSAGNFRKIPRRIALNVLKIVEGQNASDLSVEVETFTENIILNMATARQIEIYPTFDMMSRASLIDIEKNLSDRTLTFKEAVALGLSNNLNAKIEQTDVSISQTEIDIARSKLLPQIDVSTSLSLVDDLTALSYQGAQGRTNWILSGQLSQIVFSEPSLANIAIQKMLKKSEEQQLLQTQLDVIIDVASAYINILFAQNNLKIQQQNVKQTRENYDISKTKEAIGYIGASDINRWEAELATKNIDLNAAYAGLRQAKFQLNQLLNLPVDEEFGIEDISLEDAMLLVLDERANFVNDYGKIEKFADFLVDYALKNLPEIAQIDMALAVQKRLQLSRERAMYMPSLALSGSANRVLAKFDVPEMFPESDNALTWNLGLGLSYPVFQGGNRRQLIEQSNLEVLQLNATKQNTQNQLELLIRSNLENVGVSYSRMELSQIAADASQKNFLIIQDAYSEGQANVTTLIDAQNNTLQTQLGAINATYTFILDFLTLERSIGYYNFLASSQERNAFFIAINEYFANN